MPRGFSGYGWGTPGDGPSVTRCGHVLVLRELATGGAVVDGD